jgi:hypothetical protein
VTRVAVTLLVILCTLSLVLSHFYYYDTYSDKSSNDLNTYTPSNHRDVISFSATDLPPDKSLPPLDQIIKSGSKTRLREGLTVFRGMLKSDAITALKSHLLSLESHLSSLDPHDLRWCKRYCKNMFYFSSRCREFGKIVGLSFAQHVLQGSGTLYLLNDELSYNVMGEVHEYSWHLDDAAWFQLPDDAHAWTIYIPADRAQLEDGGGWLRFRDHQNTQGTEEDVFFQPGDVLVFDRWIWHKLADFSKTRSDRVAYLLRVTNDTRYRPTDFSPSTVAPFSIPGYPVGYQITSLCEGAPSFPCRLPLVSGEWSPPRFQLNTSLLLQLAHEDIIEGRVPESRAENVLRDVELVCEVMRLTSN